MNTHWIIREILFGGYTPRSITVEYNRNFHTTDAYMSINVPTSEPNGCWFGASGLALERILKAFNYSLVAFDQQGSKSLPLKTSTAFFTRSPDQTAVNLFFVHNDELGGPFPHTFADLRPNYQLEAWKPLHAECPNRLWVLVDDSPGLALGRWFRNLHPILLTHRPMGASQRRFVNVELGGALVMHPCFSPSRRHSRHGPINCKGLR